MAINDSKSDGYEDSAAGSAVTSTVIRNLQTGVNLLLQEIDANTVSYKARVAYRVTGSEIKDIKPIIAWFASCQRQLLLGNLP